MGTGSDGTIVGTGVSGMVAVGTGVALGDWVGVAVRGAGVAVCEGDELGEDDGDGLADGAATVCCEAITAAPRSSSATSATAAKTVNTVDHRSA